VTSGSRLRAELSTAALAIPQKRAKVEQIGFFLPLPRIPFPAFWVLFRFGGSFLDHLAPDL
jgi:hypothetical protein